VEWRYRSTHSFFSALDGDECSPSRPVGFTPTERVAGSHWIGSWVGPRGGLDTVSRKISSPCGNSNPDHPGKTICNSVQCHMLVHKEREISIHRRDNYSSHAQLPLTVVFITLHIFLGHLLPPSRRSLTKSVFILHCFHLQSEF